jgi:hypothetical protein
LSTGIYSAFSGAVATVAGAAASLAAPAAYRVAVWCLVAGVVSVGAGLIWVREAGGNGERAIEREVIRWVLQIITRSWTA